MIDLVVVSSGRTPELIEMTRNCIASFQHTCTGKIVVVEEYPVRYDARVIAQSKPFNYNQCLNDGMDCTTADWVCFANNDVVFMDGWAKIIEYGYESVSPFCPGWFKHKGYTGLNEGYSIGIELCGWCIVANRHMIRRIGGFPTGVDFWLSDNLYADVLIHHGIKHAMIGDCHVKHVPSRTLIGHPNQTLYTSGQVSKYNEARKQWI